MDETVSQLLSKAEALKLSGNSKFETLDFDGAIADWTAAMQIDVDDSAVTIVCSSNIAAAYMKRGDWHNALRFASDAIEGHVQHPTPLFWRSRALRNLGKIDEAITDLRCALQLSDDPAVRKELSFCIFSRHSTDCCPVLPHAASGDTVCCGPRHSSAAGTHSAAVVSYMQDAFIARFEAHSARSLARPSRAFASELTAHPLYCLASRISMQRLQATCRRLTPLKALPQQWSVLNIAVGRRQRQQLVCRGALCETLVHRLMLCHVDFGATSFLSHATCVVSRRHFLVSKNRASRLFKFGQRLFEQQRFSNAARSWGQAALLQHAASHAFLSDMLIDGKLGVSQDHKRAFELAAAGAAMGCTHSKGALGRCFFNGFGVAADVGKGLALARESAAAGSCFGQYVVARCYDGGWDVAQNDAEALRLYHLAAAQRHSISQVKIGKMYEDGCGVTQDKIEAVRWLRLAAAQGNAQAQFNLGCMIQCGEGAEQDDAEAARLHRLAAAQGYADAQFFLGCMCEEGRGVAQDRIEATRWFLLAAAYQHAKAQFRLGLAYEKGRGVPQDREEAIRWYDVAAFQGFSPAENRLRRCCVVLRDALAATY
jgi:TPR repeat protein